jgi:hypothetical protein
VECQAFRSDDDELYTLTGDTGPNTGERVGDLNGMGNDTMDGVEGGSTGETPVGEPAADGQLLLEGELTDEGVESGLADALRAYTAPQRAPAARCATVAIGTVDARERVVRGRPPNDARPWRASQGDLACWSSRVRSPC